MIQAPIPTTEQWKKFAEDYVLFRISEGGNEDKAWNAISVMRDIEFSKTRIKALEFLRFRLHDYILRCKNSFRHELTYRWIDAELCKYIQEGEEKNATEPN